jgi:hypothetical protein
LVKPAWITALLLGGLSWPFSSPAQELRGQLEVLAAGYPVLETVEGRSRIFLRLDHQLGSEWFLRAAGYVDAVVGAGGRTSAAILRPHEVYLDYRRERVELRVGLANLVWGVLDEIQPSDRVNPLDVARFVLEGRSEAKLPIPMVRGRLYLDHDWLVEAVWAPWARRGTFDQLHEPTSPFNPARQLDTPSDTERADSDDMEGGLRLRHTDLGVDWSVSVYRDVADFDFRDTVDHVSPAVRAVRPVRWMLGGDFETVVGRWGFRGELAFDFDDPRQLPTPPRILRGTSASAGLGLDRHFGENRLFLNGLYSRVPFMDDSDRLDFVGGISRRFGRGRRELRLFGLWSALDDSGFARAILDAEIVENLRLLLSGGIFIGRSSAVFGFDDADFLASRFRFFF